MSHELKGEQMTANENHSEWQKTELRESLKVVVSAVPLGPVTFGRSITDQEDRCKKNDTEI